MREFTDSDGMEWQVWEVNPTIHERPLKAGKSRTFLKVPQSWLCFSGGSDRRRLTPVPEGWEQLDDAALETLRNQAEAAPQMER